MTRFRKNLRGLATAAALCSALLLAPAAADAAKLRISGGTLAVDDNGVAHIKVKNPNRSRAKGKLSLKSGSVAIGSRRFNIAAKRSKRVGVQLSLPALEVLANGDALKAVATAKAKGKGTSRKSLILYYPPAVNGGGGDTGGGGQTGPGYSEGRWQGTYAENNVDLAFNVAGGRLYTGPFDAFYIDAVCDNEDAPDGSAIEPIEATINPDGSFSGAGTYTPGGGEQIHWTLTGHISGTTISDGVFSVDYVNYGGNHCSGTTHFTAGWYGDYTAKPIVLR